MKDNISILDLIAGNNLGAIPSLERRNALRIWQRSLKVISRLSNEDFDLYGKNLILCAKNLENQIFN